MPPLLNASNARAERLLALEDLVMPQSRILISQEQDRRRISGMHQLCEEVCRLRCHAAVHAKALDVLQVGRQLWRVRMDDHIDEHRQEVISTCNADYLLVSSLLVLPASL